MNIADRFKRNARRGKSPAQLQLDLKKAERYRQRELKRHLEQSLLLELWRKEHKKKIDELLSGSYSAAARELMQLLNNLTPRDGVKLLATVKRGPWREADADTRYLVLNLIDQATSHARERQGLPPFDDALPFSDDRLTVFQLIKDHLEPC
jgi:hypothetical protein